MTRDELVQAAIEALDADNPGSTYIDTEIDVVDGSLTDVVRAVVDAVLKAQKRRASSPIFGASFSTEDLAPDDR